MSKKCLTRSRPSGWGRDTVPARGTQDFAHPDPSASGSFLSRIVVRPRSLLLLVLVACAMSLSRNVGAEEPTITQHAGTDAALIEELAAAPSMGTSGFIGDYGELLQLPAGYKVFAKFQDPSKPQPTEVAWFFPQQTPGDFLQREMGEGHWQESRYGQLGVIRLEVGPKNRSGMTMSLEDWR